MSIFVHPEAAAELNEAASFYAQQANMELGLALITEVERVLALLEKNPTLGAFWKGNVRRLPLRRFPYNVVYRLNAGVLEILAVAHQHRRPGYWKKRQ